MPQIRGQVRIEAIALADNLDQIWLDFVGFEILQLNVSGIPVAYAREARKLLVTLPQPVMSGTLFTVDLTYQGEPVRESSPYVGFTEALGLHAVGDDSIYTLSEPDGARYWFPANDHPRDKAFFRVEVSVPSGLTAVSNGQLMDVRQAEPGTLPGGGTGRTFVWEHNHPMATYLALVAVGPFERIESVTPGGVPLRHYVTAEHRDELLAAVAPIGEALDWMSALFGPYPFEAFGYVVTEMPPTAMETQTMVLLAHEFIGQRTAVHELAHMWFGDWVSPDSWSEMWRKEGLATYITMLWETRDNPEALDGQMEEVLAAVAQNTPQYPIGNPPAGYLLNYNTYFKGAAVIHALRRQLGDEAFFAGLRTYLSRYGGGTASDAQFQAVMEEFAGSSLDDFFAGWLN
jgi:aminopeptidase N